MGTDRQLRLAFLVVFFINSLKEIINGELRILINGVVLLLLEDKTEMGMHTAGSGSAIGLSLFVSTTGIVTLGSEIGST